MRSIVGIRSAERVGRRAGVIFRQGKGGGAAERREFTFVRIVTLDQRAGGRGHKNSRKSPHSGNSREPVPRRVEHPTPHLYLLPGYFLSAKHGLQGFDIVRGVAADAGSDDPLGGREREPGGSGFDARQAAAERVHE